MRLLILLLTTSIFLVSSCSIQKRTFRNGYYISWNKSVKKDKAQSKDEVTDAEEEQLTESTAFTDTICREPEKTEELCVVENEQADTLQTKELAQDNDSTVKKPAVQYSETALLERLNEAVESIKERKFPDLEKENPEKKLNLFAPNAFVFAVGYVVLIFLAYDSGFSGSIFLAVVAFLLALIFAIVALVKWKRNRTKFWGTFFALMALILLAAGTLAFLVYVLFTSASFG